MRKRPIWDPSRANRQSESGSGKKHPQVFFFISGQDLLYYLFICCQVHKVQPPFRWAFLGPLYVVVGTRVCAKCCRFFPASTDSNAQLLSQTSLAEDLVFTVHKKAWPNLARPSCIFFYLLPVPQACSLLRSPPVNKKQRVALSLFERCLVVAVFCLIMREGGFFFLLCRVSFFISALFFFLCPFSFLSPNRLLFFYYFPCLMALLMRLFV